MSSAYKQWTIAQIHDIYCSKKSSVTELTQEFLKTSKEIDKKIQSVLRFTDDLAIQKAKELDQIWDDFVRQGKSFEDLILKYPIFGVPYALKDNILVEGQISTSASKSMEGFIAPYSATVYKLLDQAGGVLISQVNLDEWAVGCSTENSAFQKTYNPFGENRVPGGSSGGPAAVVGSGQVVFSLGSDTGGSIRLPSAFCNSVGAKPTYGAISRFGVMPLASSLDQVGPITHNVSDNELILAILSQNDHSDQTNLKTFSTVNSKLFTESFQTNPAKSNKMKIGIPAEYYEEGLDIRIKERLLDLQAVLREEFEIVPVSLPLTKYGLSIYYITMTVETAANLERFDGIRYSPQVEIGNSDELYFNFREKLLGEEPKRRIMLGTYTSSSGYYDAYYNTANKVKAMMQTDFERVFQEVDLLLCPTTSELPFKFGAKTENPLAMYLSDAMVYGANLAKLPAVSVPIGFIEENDEVLPVGCQIIGPEKSEAIMYQLAKNIEQKVKV
jgi:aspartyl-tRNA(Asn)/glutamyl-tRNA(Gln) amidotransferase subunit A